MLSQADNRYVSTAPNPRNKAKLSEGPWAILMRGTSTAEPSRLVAEVAGAIIDCGGWVLSRSANDSGLLSFLFEFERHCCLDVYTALISTGLDLSQNAHLRFTEMCQCTSLTSRECGWEIVSIELEIQALCAERAGCGLD